MNKETEMKCENCIYWRHFHSVGSLGSEGFCHRYPPIVNPILAKYNSELEQEEKITEFGKMMAVHPKTFASDWCGEFESK